MRSVHLAASLVVSCWLSACEQASPPAEKALARSARLASKEGAARVVAGVTWPSAAQIDRAALAALPSAVVREARTSRVPVLVPSRRELLGAPVVVVREHWTSFWAKSGDITVSVTMTRLARKYDGIPPQRGPQSVRGRPAYITNNEGIWSATWIENGVSYALDVECASPDAPGCASDALVRELAAELVYVGGSGAKDAGGAP